ncbi:hypothetical protein OGZ02_00265 [Brachyspira hyodysenteriae]|nr:hypothetical protein [Brachyspira hyodysenteriae]
MADTFVINGVECEPYITSDYRLMIEYTQDLFKGIEILRKNYTFCKKNCYWYRK